MKTIKLTQLNKMAAMAVTGLVLLFVPLSHGATVTVNVVGDSFSPSSVTINVGDTVEWVGLNNAHNVTGSTASDLSEFCGSSLSSFATESSCSHTFTTAGTFPYQCTLHAQCCGMVGSVTVVAAAPTPTVSITNPAAGAVFSAPANLRLGATAAVSGGTVTNVAFFAGATPLGSVQTSPFNITSPSLGAGNYSLTAVATAAGVSTTSAVVNISVVTPVAISNSAPVVANSQFSFSYSANMGLTYVVQRSPDLVNWTAISTNVASSNPVDFAVTLPVSAAAFYRVALQPNP